MNYKEAKTFVEKLYDIWLNGTVNQLADIYDKSIKADYFGQPNLGFSDIENRFEFMKKTHKNRQYTILDLIVQDNKIALYTGYTALTKDSEPLDISNMSIMHFNEQNKIQRIWVMANVPVNYLEKAS